ncbi:MAG: TonB-dependent receptor plug domain-containing protein, partial [Bdellovibrionales bacterium]|nr:TonB-dependent receptor plug domain-containing protein [Bdellovibrionales bacterium]
MQRRIGIIFCVGLFCGLSAHGADTDERETWLSPVEVFGTQSEVIEYPNEPQRVSSKKLEIFQTTDVARALKQVSGTYVREEDGFGLRPNIGMRGTSPDRSKKIVLLEDGILIGPAPYSAPAAYYSPSMMMVDSLEVYKGFGSLPFGPNSIGGTVNYLTTPIPQSQEARLKLTGGSFNTALIKGSFGGALGNSAYLVEAARMQTDGFKKLPAGGKTGFEQNQFLLKWMLKLPNSDGLEHNLRVHAGYGDERSSETYLGLASADFYRDPYNRMAASEKDQMKWTHGKLQLHHQIQISPTLMVQSAIYQQTFHRAWYRLDGMRDTSVNLRDILRDTQTYSNYYEVLAGRLDSTAIGTNAQLFVVNNDRKYFSRGVQNQWTGSFISGEVSNDFELGWRYHEDQIDREHTSDRYDMISGRMVQTADPRQRDTLNTEGAKAWTVVLLNHLKWNGWTASPALRFES